MWLYLLALAILGVIVLLLMGRWDGAAVPEEESGAEPPSVDDLAGPGGRIGAEGLRQVRFEQTFRGYRMDQVDALLDRLAEQLGEASEEPPHTPEEAPRDRP